MKKSIRSIFAVALSCAMVLALAFPASGASYNDTSGHWAEGTIDTWAARSLIAGYPGGVFNPNSYITRAEVAAILSRFGLTPLRTEKNFTDNEPGSWYEEGVKKASATGLIDGYPDGTFLPNANITRREAFVIAAKCLPKTDVSSAVITFTDRDSIPEWASEYAKILLINNMLGGYPDGTVRGERNITRAEFVTLFSFLLSYTDISLISANISGWIGLSPTASPTTATRTRTSATTTSATSATSSSSTSSTTSPPSTTRTSTYSSSATTYYTPSASPSVSTSVSAAPSSTTGEVYKVSMSVKETTSGGERVILANYTDNYAPADSNIDAFFVSASMNNYDALKAGFADDESAKELIKGAAQAFFQSGEVWANYVDQYRDSVGQTGGGSVNLKTALKESKPLTYLGEGSFSFQYNVAQPTGGTRQYTTTITIAK
jgi:hypothetical protein